MSGFASTRSIAAGLLVGALLIGLSSAPLAARSVAGSGTTPAIQDQYQWGWVNHVSGALGLYTPDPINRGNSAGRKNTVNHFATGGYEVTFKYIGGSGGHVQVSVLKSPDRFCMIGAWRPVTVSGTRTDEQVEVQCYDSTGTSADAQFTASYLFTNYANHRMGYLWADHPSDDYDTDGPEDSYYSFNSTNAINHVTRTALGRYTVTFRGLATGRGDVQVTPYVGSFFTAGVRPADVIVGTCGVFKWDSQAGNVRVFVRCFNVNGLATDSRFTVAFMQKQGLKGPGSGDVAYVYANEAATGSYTPTIDGQFSHPAGLPHVTRQSTGHYTVTLSGIGAGGTVKVTTRNQYSVNCIVAKIRTNAAPQKVKVRCSTFGGDPVDSRFYLAYQA